MTIERDDKPMTVDALLTFFGWHDTDKEEAGYKAARAAIEQYGREQRELAEGECDAITEINHAQWLQLENVRLLAGRHRHEEWAQHMLRFCEEAGNASKVLRQPPKREQRKAVIDELLDVTNPEDYVQIESKARAARAARALRKGTA